MSINWQQLFHGMDIVNARGIAECINIVQLYYGKLLSISIIWCTHNLLIYITSVNIVTLQDVFVSRGRMWSLKNDILLNRILSFMWNLDGSTFPSAPRPLGPTLRSLPKSDLRECILRSMSKPGKRNIHLTNTSKNKNKQKLKYMMHKIKSLWQKNMTVT